MKIGYLRISTHDQNSDLQEDALEKAGCEKLFKDIASGAKTERKALSQAIEFARAGDTLVVWKLDRLGRSVKHLLELADIFKTKRIELISLQDAIDTTTATGKMLFTMMGALAEFELSLIRERTEAGLAAARARGKSGGRPGLSEKKIKLLNSMQKDKSLSVGEITKTLGIHKSTFYKHLNSNKEKSQ